MEHAGSTYFNDVVRSSVHVEVLDSHCQLVGSLASEKVLADQRLMKIILKPPLGSPCPCPVEKLPSTVSVSGTKKVRDHCSKELNTSVSLVMKNSHFSPHFLLSKVSAGMVHSPLCLGPR